MKKNKIILIGPIDDYETPSGPSNVIINLLNQDNEKFDFINSYCRNKLDKIKLYFDIIKLIFVKNTIINVHSFGYRIPKLVLNISKINKSNKYYLTLHGLMSIEAKLLATNGFYSEYKKKSKYYDYLERKLINEFPNIICISNIQRKILKKKYGRFKNTFVLHNGINIFKKPNKKTSILNNIKIIMAGGIFQLKGIFELVDFIEYYNKRFDTKLFLDIFGGIESQEILDKFKKIIIDKNMEKYIEYKGKIDNSKLLEKFEEAHLCITFSKFDSFNLTILESMSKKTPVIISKQAGVSELISNGKNGFIIDMNKDFIKETCNIINNIINKKYIYDDICDKAYDTAKNNQWSNTYKNFLSILQRGI